MPLGAFRSGNPLERIAGYTDERGDALGRSMSVWPVNRGPCTFRSANTGRHSYQGRPPMAHLKAYSEIL